MARTPKPYSPLRSLWNLAWRAPLLAVPFAAFFHFIQSAPWAHFGQFYAIALVFSYTISLGIWLTSYFDQRVVRGRALDATSGGRRLLEEGGPVEFAAGLPARQDPRAQIDAMLADLRGFLAGEEPQDDVTLMVLRVREVAS